MRILLEPTGGEGGGATPPPTSTPTPTPPAPSTPPTPSPTPTPAEGGKVYLTPEEYRGLLEAQTKLAESEARARREAEDKEAQKLAAQVAKGEGDKALQTLRESKDAEIARERTRADQLEVERLTDRKDAAIAAALVGASFASDAAARDARLVLEGRFEAIRGADGKVQVVERATRRPAEGAIKDWLASEDSAHYRKATTTGGAGGKGGDRTGSGEPVKQPTFAEAMILRERERLATPDNSYIGLVRRN